MSADWKPPVTALVTPWFGTGKGGAEVFCGGLARAVAALGRPVEILTTCCIDPFRDWGRDQCEPGEEAFGPVTVRRFRVSPRNADIYHHYSRLLDSGFELAEPQQEELLANSVNSRDLCRFITRHGREYRFFFLPYLYGTTFFGMRASFPRHAFLIPCLHNEPYAYMSVLQGMFARARGCLFLSPPERDLATALYGLHDARRLLLGGGVTRECLGDGARFRRAARLDAPFALFVGRKVPGKGADILLRCFREYLAARPDSPLHLVLIGGGQLEIPDGLRGRAHSLEAATHDEVRDAMAACEFLVHPSLYESFSIVMMEAWLNGKPVLVNGECEVTLHHVLQSRGGLYFTTVGEFVEAAAVLEDNPALARRMGSAGAEYVRQHYLWPDVAMRFHNFLADLDREDRDAAERRAVAS